MKETEPTSLDDWSPPDGLRDLTTMSDRGLSGVVVMLPLDGGAADRVRLLERTFTGW